MTIPLEQHFPEELSVLEVLFSEAQVQSNIPRLDQIHSCTEALWHKYVEKLSGGPVKYLLIAEAPPWSDAGEIQYVLCPASGRRTLMKALRKVFSIPDNKSGEESLAVFARKGFLVVDSIPFSMPYSGMRQRRRYKDLVSLTAQTYLQAKLNLRSLKWSPNVRMAFSVKCNALAVIKGLGGKLYLNRTSRDITPEMIAVNGAGYPDADKLLRIWGI